MRSVTRELLGQMCFVVREKLGVVAATRHGHVSQSSVDEFFSCLLRVHMYQHAVGVSASS